MPSFDCSNIDVEDFLECLEIENVSKATAEEFRFSCPFPNHDNGDANASAYMNMETTAWFCHGCKSRGDAKTFTSDLLGISPLEAIRMLKQRYQPGYMNPDAVSMVSEVKKILDAKAVKPPEQPILDESEAADRAIDWVDADESRLRGSGWIPSDYMLERGFSPEILDEWEFGYDWRTDRISFAIRDEEGRLIGFKARAFDGQEPKYLVLGDKEGNGRFGFPRYYPSRVVYGAHKVPADSDVIVCEGELNVVAIADKAGLPAVAINGSNFTDHHARIIAKIANAATLFLDDDMAGNTAVWGHTDNDGRRHPGIVERLAPLMRLKIVNSSKDAADLSAQELKEVLESAESAVLARVKRANLLRS